MKVVHLTTLHDRGDTRVFHKECRTLAGNGYDVTLVVADGLGNERRDGVAIVDIGRRPANRVLRMGWWPWRARRAVARLDPALLHLHDPELLIVGLAFERAGVRVVYDSHEDVPQQILSKHWLPAWTRAVVSALFTRLERTVAPRLSGVVVANPSALPRFQAWGCRVVAICNFPLLEEFPAPSSVAGEPGAIAYVGGLTRARGVVHLVEALGLLPEARLLLCGRFTDDGSEAACRALPGWRQVEYLGQVDRAGVQAVLGRAQVGMVTLLAEPNYLVNLPVKLFEYMAAALPVVASNIPLWVEVVDGHRCGLCVDPADARAIAAAVEALLQASERREMGARGRRAVLEHYSWPGEAVKLLDHYRAILGDAAPAVETAGTHPQAQAGRADR